MFTNQIFRNKVISIANDEYKSPVPLSEKIKKYLSAVGLGPNHNYCVAFVYWCHEQAVSAMGATYNPMPKTARVGTLFDFAGSYNLFVPTPEIGDIYISSTKGHSGLIRESNPNYTSEKTKTVEGNTYIERDIDGDGELDLVWGVHHRNKNLSSAYFIRL